MPDNFCRYCKNFNKAGALITFPDGSQYLADGFGTIPGGTGYESEDFVIAKCTEPTNFWANITRNIRTSYFMNDADKRDVMEKTGVLGAGEFDICPLFDLEPGALVASVSVSNVLNRTKYPLAIPLQFEADVQPETAIDRSVTWDVVPDDGDGTVTQEGVFTGTVLGEVRVRATSNDDPTISDNMVIELIKPVTSITVDSAGSVTQVEEGNTLQFYETLLPIDATYLTVTWTVNVAPEFATIDSAGLLTAVAPIASVMVRATADDETGVYGEFEIEITAAP
jgi:hypothetical protein